MNNPPEVVHDPVVEGSGLSHWGECPACPGGKLHSANGPIVGTYHKVSIAANYHRAKMRSKT
jgi:hypothetical protein